MQLDCFFREFSFWNNAESQLVNISPFLLRQSGTACDLQSVVPRLELPHLLSVAFRRAWFEFGLLMELKYSLSALHPQQWSFFSWEQKTEQGRCCSAFANNSDDIKLVFKLLTAHIKSFLHLPSPFIAFTARCTRIKQGKTFSKVDWSDLF